MKRLTSGTLPYKIPLPKPYKLKGDLSLIIRTDDDGVIVECPLFDEYGYGSNYDEALRDLGQSIASLMKILMRLTIKQ